MTDDLPPNPALLPAGLRDLLPPEAETEASAVESLMNTFAAHGYQRVKPPLLEFEDSLLLGSGSAVADISAIGSATRRRTRATRTRIRTTTTPSYSRSIRRR